MNEISSHCVADKRPLTSAERDLILWLIANGSSNAAKYASQLAHVTVLSRCTCGCPTVNLAVNGEYATGNSETIGNAEGTSPEGVKVGVILHCRGGLLSELEVYSIDGYEGQFGLPSPDDLVAFPAED
jgi:hypothetical protein